ncbi:Cysteine protease atg4, partial [Nowakowskiella sp. JEL0078]
MEATQPIRPTETSRQTSAASTLWHRLSLRLSTLLSTTEYRLERYGFLMSYFHSDYADPQAISNVVLLSRTYASIDSPEFLADFHSRLWLTYRHSYPPIKPSQYTSDVGWGCMLRSGQMLLASGFLLHYLGRVGAFFWGFLDWRLPNRDKASWEKYVKIVSWFLDSNTSPYSIHRIALLGKQYDKDIGEWFGPSTISNVLKSLIQTHKDSSMGLHVCTDGGVYKDQVLETLLKEENEEMRSLHVSGANRKKYRPLLMLVPLRLGIDNLNPVYIPALKKCFEMQHCVGVAGGRPNSSLFFIGVE